MKNSLNTRQNSFVKHIASGNSATQSAILSGYSKRSARFTASKLLTNANILQQLEEIFDKAGLSDEQLVDRLKTAIDAGIGVKPTNGDALKGLRMIFDLKNRFPSPQIKAEITQQDEIQMKLEHLSEEELIAHIEQTALKTQDVLERIKQRRLERKNGDGNRLATNQSPRQIPSEDKDSHIVTVVPDLTSKDTNVRRAVGVSVESKIVKRPTYKLSGESKSLEDEPYHQKISYPA